ncbi:hypothetical protein BH10ACT9_BH10ACT9_39330 [soil metagenome]
MARHYSLDPAMPVLVRPDGIVQFGWDPRRAVVVRPPHGVSAAALAEVLRLMQAGTRVDSLVRKAGVAVDDFSTLVDALIRAGIVSLNRTEGPPRAPAIQVHGRGPLSDLLIDALRCSGARIKHTTHTHAVLRPERTDLVVLADYLVADPRLLRELHDTRIPHLQARVRDGVGLIGPLVLPGLTSCLGCADLHRSDRDKHWPAVAAQLRDTVGTADRATVLATAALALSQIDTVLGAIRGVAELRPPATLSTTLEFDAATSSIATRHWPRHPLCGC